MSDTVNATESAVKLAEAEGLDLSTVTGTGAEGRITKADAEQALAAREEGTPKTAAPKKKTITVALLGSAPFGAVDLPGADPSIVVKRGESAEVPPQVAAAIRAAAKSGALQGALAAYLEVDGKPLA